MNGERFTANLITLAANKIEFSNLHLGKLTILQEWKQKKDNGVKNWFSEQFSKDDGGKQKSGLLILLYSYPKQLVYELAPLFTQEGGGHFTHGSLSSCQFSLEQYSKSEKIYHPVQRWKSQILNNIANRLNIVDLIKICHIFIETQKGLFARISGINSQKL